MSGIIRIVVKSNVGKEEFKFHLGIREHLKVVQVIDPEGKILLSAPFQLDSDEPLIVQGDKE